MSKELIEELNEQVLTYDEWAREKCTEKLAANRIEELERELAAERKRVSSYKLLVSSMEKQKDIHQAERTKFRESLATLDSERAANELLTQERDALQADNARLREAITEGLDTYKVPRTARICEALAATPAQSLARLRNQVLEECAKVCEWQTEGFAATSTWDEAALSCAKAIRATKEPE